VKVQKEKKKRKQTWDSNNAVSVGIDLNQNAMSIKTQQYGSFSKTKSNK